MPRIFTTPLTVAIDAIDEMHHVNNLKYLAWMQDVATAHSAAQGWPLERYLEAGAGWVVRSHTITYQRPARLDDAITLLTWVAELGVRTSLRKYLFWRAGDNRVLAKAETLWAYVDFATGVLRPIPADLKAAFEIVEDENEPLRLARRSA